MSAGLTIRADGMEWPLATFIDAYGFHQLDWRSSTAPLDTDLTLEVVVREGDGVAVKRMIGRHVDRHNCLAIKGADGNSMCEGCGMPFEPDEPPIYASDVETRRVYTVNSYETEYCRDCQIEGEWDW